LPGETVAPRGKAGRALERLAQAFALAGGAVLYLEGRIRV